MNSNDFIFHIEDGVIFIDGLRNQDTADIVFPDSLEGLDRIVISENAFSNNKTISSVTLSMSVIEIKDYAFSNCQSLKEFKFGRLSNLKIGNLIFNNCENVEHVELNISLLRYLQEMFSNESYYSDDSGFHNVTKKQLDNGHFYASSKSTHQSVHYDRDGDKYYTYSTTYGGFIPNKLKSISLYFTNHNSNSWYSIPSLKYFIHLETLEYLDEIHDMHFFPKGFDVTRTKNFPSEYSNISSDFFKEINAGRVHISSKSGRIERNTFDTCDYEELIFDDDVELKEWRLWKSKINGNLRLPEGMKKLFLQDVEINGEIIIPDSLEELKFYSIKHKKPIEIPNNVTNIEILSTDVSDIINNSHASKINLTACENTHLFKLNNEVVDLTLGIAMKEHKTNKKYEEIPYLPDSVNCLCLDGYQFKHGLLENSNVKTLKITPRNQAELNFPRMELNSLYISSGYEAAVPISTIDLSNVKLNGKLTVSFCESLTKLISPLSAKELEIERCQKLSLIVVPNHVEQDKVKLNLIANRYTIVYPVTLKKYRYGKTISVESFTGPTKIIFKNPFIKLDSELNWDSYTHHVYHQYNLKSVVFYGKDNIDNNELVPYWDSKHDYNSFSIEKGKKHNKKFIKKLSNDIEALIEYPVGGINEKEIAAFSLRIKGKLKTTNNVKITVTEKQLNKVIYETASQNNGLLCSDIFDFDFNNVVELGYLLLEIRIDEISSDENLPLINDVITIRF